MLQYLLLDVLYYYTIRIIRIRFSIDFVCELCKHYFITLL